jgi:urease beta subunit
MTVTGSIVIRTDAIAEQKALEATAASLTNNGDREALLANPDAIKISLEQLAAERIFGSELSGVTVVFSAIEPRVEEKPNLVHFLSNRTVAGGHWTVNGRILRRSRTQARPRRSM